VGTELDDAGDLLPFKVGLPCQGLQFLFEHGRSSTVLENRHPTVTSNNDVSFVFFAFHHGSDPAQRREALVSFQEEAIAWLDLQGEDVGRAIPEKEELLPLS